jgi:glutathione S-transferase
MPNILYSFRRCPYAMRARLAIQLCLKPASLELREVVLKNKPQAMLDISPKATVPVLQLLDETVPNGFTVIDESIDIMRWAFKQNPVLESQYYAVESRSEIDELISENDGDFKWALDRYKYSDRFEHDEDYYRLKADVFLSALENRLKQQPFLLGAQISLADLAVFPFVRQFAHVDKAWFEKQEAYQKLNTWLQEFLNGDLFDSIMKKYPAWAPESEQVNFPRIQ